MFSLVQRARGASDDEMFSTFNMGIGMVLVVDPQHAQEVMHRNDERAFRVGTVARARDVRISSAHWPSA